MTQNQAIALILVGSAWVLCARSLQPGQPGQPPDPLPTCSLQSHIDQLPPGDMWFIQEKTIGWFDTHAPESNITQQIKKTGWRTFAAYACGVYPCGTIHYPGPAIIEQTMREETCWGAEGSVSGSAKLGLLTKLITDLEAGVSIGGHYSKCIQKETRIVDPIPKFPCYPRHVREVMFHRMHFGTVTEGERWRWIRATGEETFTFCNLKHGSAEAWDDIGWDHQVAHKACLGDPIPPDDIHDGKRELHCCDPACLGGDVCCGCSGVG